MARPRTVSDQQILDAARRLIRTRGPHVPVEVIAAEVGVSQQAVLKRFGSWTVDDPILGYVRLGSA